MCIIYIYKNTYYILTCIKIYIDKYRNIYYIHYTVLYYTILYYIHYYILLIIIHAHMKTISITDSRTHVCTRGSFYFLALKGRSSTFAKNQRNLRFCSSLCIFIWNSTNSKIPREIFQFPWHEDLIGEVRAIFQ